MPFSIIYISPKIARRAETAAEEAGMSLQEWIEAAALSAMKPVDPPNWVNDGDTSVLYECDCGEMFDSPRAAYFHCAF